MGKRILILILLAAPQALASAPEGIPRGLARQRAAQISDIRYELCFVLTPHVPAVVGREKIQFKLPAARPMLLDYRDGKVKGFTVNGTFVEVKAENGHYEIPAKKLRAGENTITTVFFSQVAPAGKPLIRFEDRDDHTEYIYTLFVPMDASMAFPCFDQPDMKARFRLTVRAPSQWTIISNTAPAITKDSGATKSVTF